MSDSDPAPQATSPAALNNIGAAHESPAAISGVRELDVHLVAHTHWDREWYRTHEQFRYRLVSLVDELLDLLERDPAYRHFMLDGQTIVVDDYLEVRPHARARIEKLVREGRIAIGPWHVLPDEWLVSGEALLRNLRIGVAKAQAFSALGKRYELPESIIKAATERRRLTDVLKHE